MARILRRPPGPPPRLTRDALNALEDVAELTASMQRVQAEYEDLWRRRQQAMIRSHNFGATYRDIAAKADCTVQTAHNQVNATVKAP